MTPSQMNELAEKEYPIKSWMDVSTQIEVKNERAAFIHGLQHSSGQVKEDWISVETELPNKSGLYLIVVAPTNDIYISFYKKDAKLFQVWGAGRDPINDMKTTHYQPLPNPPANQTLTEK